MISTIVDHYNLNFSNMINSARIENSLKIQNVYFEKAAAKKHKFFNYLRGQYFVMGSPKDMNVGVI